MVFTFLVTKGHDHEALMRFYISLLDDTAQQTTFRQNAMYTYSDGFQLLLSVL